MHRFDGTSQVIKTISLSNAVPLAKYIKSHAKLSSKQEKWEWNAFIRASSARCSTEMWIGCLRYQFFTLFLLFSPSLFYFFFLLLFFLFRQTILAYTFVKSRAKWCTDTMFSSDRSSGIGCSRLRSRVFVAHAETSGTSVRSRVRVPSKSDFL